MCCVAKIDQGYYIQHYGTDYGDGAGNTVKENSSIFSLIRMR